MSNQPPPDPLQPFNPSQPYGRPRPDDAAQVSGQPWSTPSGDPLADGPVQPPRPPEPGRPAVPYPTQPLPGGTPTYQPGSASLPPPEAYPPTSQFPAQPGYDPAQAGYDPPTGYDPAQAGYGSPAGYDAAQAGYGPPPHVPGQPWQPGPPGPPPPPPPRRSNAPLIAVILAVTVLLCGGAVTAGALVINNVTDRAKEAVKPITDPTLPALPTEVPDLPTDVPGLPTDLPSLPTDLPTGIPGVPGSGKKITVVYEVTGDGPVEIVYTEKLGKSPKRVTTSKLPWTVKTTMEGTAIVSVTAVRTGTDSGTIGCRATVDGEEVATSTREGAYASATCLRMILN